MDIKVISTDMDGTFLKDSNDYDRERFKKIFSKMKKKGIKFVAISGNQYYQIKTFFKDYLDDITIVGENGGYFVENNTFLKSETLLDEVFEKIRDYVIEKSYDKTMLISGVKAGYMLKSASKEVKDYYSTYFYRIQEIDSFYNLPKDEKYIKFSFISSQKYMESIVKEINQLFGKYVQAVTSGEEDIDILDIKTNKGTAMKYLLNKWDLKSENLLAFGNGLNDKEMLESAKYSYAMENADERLKEVAYGIAPNNNASGVLEIIEKYLEIK